MNWLCCQALITAGIVASTALAAATAVEEPKGEKVPFTLHKGYFESNKSGLKGDASYLVIADQKKFDETFGLAVTMGAKPVPLPKDAFETLMVVATIHRGKAIWEYNVKSVTADKDALYVAYEATSKEGSGTATFASPMVVSVPKGKYTSVVFLENGKKVATVEVKK